MPLAYDNIIVSSKLRVKGGYMKIYDAKEGKALEWTERDNLEDFKKYLKGTWVFTYEDAVGNMVVQNTYGLTDKGNTIIDAVAYDFDDYSEELAEQKDLIRRHIFDLNFVKNWNQYSDQGIRKDGSVGPLWEIID